MSPHCSKLRSLSSLLLILKLIMTVAGFAPMAPRSATLLGQQLQQRQKAPPLLLVRLAARPEPDALQVETILFVECGFGSDAHGQDSTKAAVRACRNAIEFNQIPSISTIVPGGRDALKLDVLLAVPTAYQDRLDLDAVRNCFPYGEVNIQIQDGGMIASNGKVIEEMGDANMDMVVVCVAVTVGY